MSALTDRGSTRRWRALRQWWAEQLPLPCPRCGATVEYGAPFDLDHVIPRAQGGTDEFARPAHPGCNRAANERPVFPTRGAPDHPVSLSIFSRHSTDRSW